METHRQLIHLRQKYGPYLNKYKPALSPLRSAETGLLDPLPPEWYNFLREAVALAHDEKGPDVSINDEVSHLSKSDRSSRASTSRASTQEKRSRHSRASTLEADPATLLLYDELSDVGSNSQASTAVSA